jgi:hypothetical protein
VVAGSHRKTRGGADQRLATQPTGDVREMTVTIRSIEAGDLARWRALWDGYCRFYERETSDAIAAHVESYHGQALIHSRDRCRSRRGPGDRDSPTRGSSRATVAGRTPPHSDRGEARPSRVAGGSSTSGTQPPGAASARSAIHIRRGWSRLPTALMAGPLPRQASRRGACQSAERESGTPKPLHCDTSSRATQAAFMVSHIARTEVPWRRLEWMARSAFGTPRRVPKCAS